ncbi:MAG: nitrogen fixation protein NifE [Clostridiaceae bacterium]|jgi:nitrogenase molybdenum-iron protein alpha chain|nr:nitrogen fixation protein NifE [Clostridiaceae bacterium]
MKNTYSGIREQRRDTETYTDWGGDSFTAGENFPKRCLGRAERVFSQGLQCQQTNSVMALLSMEDAAFVLHSPVGCTGCCCMANDWFRVGQIHRGQYAMKNARVIVTNLDERDIILGGEEKLRKAIRLAHERYRPKVIFIFTSCSSGIIGDDVEAVVSEVSDEVSSVLVPIRCEGFKSKICASGYDAAFLAISKYILKDVEKGETEEDLLNLFAPPTVSYIDQVEIERILGDIGIRVNYIPFYSSLEKIRKIPNARASTAICKVFADEYMKELYEKYGIPYSHTIMPIGTRNTDKWLLGIAALFGKTAEAEQYIASEYQKVRHLVEDLRSKLQGKSVFITGGTGRSFAAAALIDDFGMKLVGIETPVYDNDTQGDIEYLNKLYGNFVVDIANMMPYEQVNLLNRLKPDVFIGVPVWAAKLGIPTTHVLDIKRPTMGYRNLAYLGSKILYQIENPGFNKNIAKHARLPYKKDWYEQDPFKYVKRS